MNPACPGVMQREYLGWSFGGLQGLDGW